MSRIDSAYKALVQEVNVINSQFNENQKLINDLYHIIESVPLNAVKFAKVSYKLKEALKQRRILKNELRLAQSISVAFSVSESYKKVLTKIDKDLSSYQCEAQESYSRIFGHEEK